MDRISSFLRAPNEPRMMGFIRLLGNKPLPTALEVEMAQRIIDGSLTGSTPIAVAEYFRNISELNTDGESYTAEWRRRSNPLILAFLHEATDDAPAGTEQTDQTAWCAAFVNWCLIRCGKQGTRSCSSGSFRCSGEVASTPSYGDIAVLKNHGYNEPCSGKGHVGFLVSLDQQASRASVLGGNTSNKITTRDFTDVTDPSYMFCRKIDSLL